MWANLIEILRLRELLMEQLFDNYYQCKIDGENYKLVNKTYQLRENTKAKFEFEAMSVDVEEDHVLKDFYNNKYRKLKTPIISEYASVLNDIVHVKFKSNLMAMLARGPDIFNSIVKYQLYSNYQQYLAMTWNDLLLENTHFKVKETELINAQSLSLPVSYLYFSEIVNERSGSIRKALENYGFILNKDVYPKFKSLLYDPYAYRAKNLAKIWELWDSNFKYLKKYCKNNQQLYRCRFDFIFKLIDAYHDLQVSLVRLDWNKLQAAQASKAAFRYFTRIPDSVQVITLDKVNSYKTDGFIEQLAKRVTDLNTSDKNVNQYYFEMFENVDKINNYFMLPNYFEIIAFPVKAKDDDISYDKIVNTLKQKLDLSATVTDKKNYKSKKGPKNAENLNISIDEIIDMDELQIAEDRIPSKYLDSTDKWSKSTHILQSFFSMLAPCKPSTPLVEMLKVDEKIRFSFYNNLMNYVTPTDVGCETALENINHPSFYLFKYIDRLKSISERMYTAVMLKCTTSPLMFQIQYYVKSVDNPDTILSQINTRGLEKIIDLNKNSFEKYLENLKEYKQKFSNLIESAKTRNKMRDIRYAVHFYSYYYKLDELILHTAVSKMKDSYINMTKTEFTASSQQELQHVNYLYDYLLNRNDQSITQFNGFTYNERRWNNTRENYTLKPPLHNAHLNQLSTIALDSNGPFANPILRLIFNRLHINLNINNNTMDYYHLEMYPNAFLNMLLLTHETKLKKQLYDHIEEVHSELNEFGRLYTEKKNENKRESEKRDSSISDYILPNVLDFGLFYMRHYWAEQNLRELSCYLYIEGDYNSNPYMHYTNSSAFLNEVKPKLKYAKQQVFKELSELSGNIDILEKEIIDSKFYTNTINNKVRIEVFIKFCTQKLYIIAYQHFKSERDYLCGFINKACPKPYLTDPHMQFYSDILDNVNFGNISIERKVGFIVQFLNRMKTRGTLVQSRTSGPSYVISLEDLKESLENMVSQLVRYAEPEINYNQEFLEMHKKYYNDKCNYYLRYVNYLEMKLKNTLADYDKNVSKQLSHSKNQVIFELDLIKKKLAAQHEKLASIEKDLKNKMDYDYELKIEELKQKIKNLMEKYQSHTEKMTGFLQVQLDLQSDSAKSQFRKLVKDLTKEPETENTKVQQNTRNTSNLQKGFDLFKSTKRDNSPSHVRPRMLNEMFSLIKINRVCSIERLGGMISKFDDERTMMKNNIEQNKRMQELFNEKENLIRKKDEELTRINNKCHTLNKLNEEQRNTIEQLRGGFVFLQQFTDSDYDRLKYLSKKIHDNDQILMVEVDSVSTKTNFIESFVAENKKRLDANYRLEQEYEDEARELGKKLDILHTKSERQSQIYNSRIVELKSKVKNFNIDYINLKGLQNSDDKSELHDEIDGNLNYNSDLINNNNNNDSNHRDSKYITFHNDTITYEDDSYGKLINGISSQNEQLEHSNQYLEYQIYIMNTLIESYDQINYVKKQSETENKNNYKEIMENYNSYFAKSEVVGRNPIYSMNIAYEGNERKAHRAYSSDRSKQELNADRAHSSIDQSSNDLSKTTLGKNLKFKVKVDKKKKDFANLGRVVTLGDKNERIENYGAKALVESEVLKKANKY